MGYPGEQLGLFTLEPTESDPAPGYDDIMIYNVSVHLSKNLHVCTYLGLVDTGQRKFLSTKLLCYDVPVRSRTQALICLYSAVIEAIRQDQPPW